MDPYRRWATLLEITASEHNKPNDPGNTTNLMILVPCHVVESVSLKWRHNFPSWRLKSPAIWLFVQSFV